MKKSDEKRRKARMETDRILSVWDSEGKPVIKNGKIVKGQKLRNDGWHKVGELKAGQEVFKHLNGAISVVYDYGHLVWPNTEELREIKELLGSEVNR